MSERIASIDVGRAVAIGFVVVLHAEVLRGMGAAGNAVYFATDAVGRFAVPFFFLTSGYLFATKTERVSRGEYVRSYVARVTSIYGYAVAIYLPLAVVTAGALASQSGASVGRAVIESLAAGLDPLGLVYYGDSVIYHLWFLPALVFSIGFLYAFVATGLTRYALPIAACLHVIGLLAESYTMGPTLSIQARDALFFGAFYTTLGYCMHTWSWHPDPDRRNRYLGLAALGAIGHLAEHYVLGYVLTDETLRTTAYTPEFSLLTVFYSTALFCYVLATPSLGRETPVPTIGRYAVGVYVYHPIALFALDGVAAFLGVANAGLLAVIGWELLVPIVAYAVSLEGYRRIGARDGSKRLRRAIIAAIPTRTTREQ
ncbi:acyltransferase 3 [Halovivax asiaticus JCM 14624]|uniref:Acyltransferase 3 n=1 Tax=Halovivax asiaticus JCM 14624 TaxID=1227490 RepID=M0BEZ9_9EURY|nr:acyltransferase [Halovivax asiaticus]ELZ09420.1 acyltransferase 3 [Halovivax asiaticus JCM 14624]